MAAQTLGPWQGTYHPDYNIAIYQNGDPSKPLTSVNMRSVTSIQTSKSLDDISGTFSITLKDRRAQGQVKPMDAVVIRFRGHNQGWGTALRGLVDTVEPTATAGVSSAEADITISGRCMAKYLQSNSMFLPVWNPASDIPTALTFGMGDASKKTGTGPRAYTPRAIFSYVYQHYIVGLRNAVGLSGTPNARFWLNATNRFDWVVDAHNKVFQVPFLQFDEDTTDQALTQMVVQGFTEGWVDEIGNVVYRRPQWDAAVTWNLSTGGLKDWDLPVSDVSMATYVEVYPSGVIGAPTAAQQALLAGRAPVPSSYNAAEKNAGSGVVTASPEFVIDTDSNGKVTATGAKNWYYQKQKEYGLRPYQITSPLLASQAQAQAQAEGLLRFMLRWDKSGSIDIPGEPGVRLGTTIYLHGPLDDQNIARTYYVEGVQHEYVEGSYYTTTLTLSHGRDPGDPGWQQMMLPGVTAAQLASESGILGNAPQSGTAVPSGFSGASGTAAGALAAAQQLSNMAIPYVYGGSHVSGGAASAHPNATAGMDCSSSVSWVLYHAGMFSSTTPIVSGEFATSWGQPGKGNEMTVWANNGHVFIEFNVSGTSHMQGNTSIPGFDGFRLEPWGPNGSTDAAGGAFTPRHWPGT